MQPGLPNELLAVIEALGADSGTEETLRMRETIRAYFQQTLENARKIAEEKTVSTNRILLQAAIDLYHKESEPLKAAVQSCVACLAVMAQGPDLEAVLKAEIRTTCEAKEPERQKEVLVKVLAQHCSQDMLKRLLESMPIIDRSPEINTVSICTSHLMSFVHNPGSINLLGWYRSGMSDVLRVLHDLMLASVYDRHRKIPADAKEINAETAQEMALFAVIDRDLRRLEVLFARSEDTRAHSSRQCKEWPKHLLAATFNSRYQTGVWGEGFQFLITTGADFNLILEQLLKIPKPIPCLEFILQHSKVLFDQTVLQEMCTFAHTFRRVCVGIYALPLEALDAEEDILKLLLPKLDNIKAFVEAYQRFNSDRPIPVVVTNEQSRRQFAGLGSANNTSSPSSENGSALSSSSSSPLNNAVAIVMAPANDVIPVAAVIREAIVADELGTSLRVQEQNRL